MSSVQPRMRHPHVLVFCAKLFASWYHRIFKDCYSIFTFHLLFVTDDITERCHLSPGQARRRFSSSDYEICYSDFFRSCDNYFTKKVRFRPKSHKRTFSAVMLLCGHLTPCEAFVHDEEQMLCTEGASEPCEYTVSNERTRMTPCLNSSMKTS